jgi:hypothetical protein
MLAWFGQGCLSVGREFVGGAARMPDPADVVGGVPCGGRPWLPVGEIEAEYLEVQPPEGVACRLPARLRRRWAGLLLFCPLWLTMGLACHEEQVGRTLVRGHAPQFAEVGPRTFKVWEYRLASRKAALGRAAAEKLPVGRALLPVLCVFDGHECPSYW